MESFVLFYGALKQYGFLSNFAKYSIKIEDVVYTCNERFIMFKKAMLFKDSKTAQKESHPAKIKKLGKGVKNFDGISIYKKSLIYVIMQNLRNI
jgi:ribA/ribD-fused uncharacterized protein